MPATGVRPPARILVAVRAMAPVAGIPPMTAEAMLASPCATSSQLARWRRPVMPSATTAESSDSIPPSAKIVNAAGNRARIPANENAGRCAAGNADGMPPKRVPMVATGSLKIHTARPASTSAIRKAGKRAAYRCMSRYRAQRGCADRQRERIERGECRCIRHEPADGVGGRVPQAEPEKIADLAREDHHRDARGKSGNDREGNIFDGGAQSRRTRRDQQHAGHQHGEHQSVIAELRDDARDHHDERSRRARDLEAAAAERRDDDAGHDGGEQPAPRRDAAGDGECQRQGQRHHGNGQPGEQVGPGLGEAVPLLQRRHQLGHVNVPARRGRTLYGSDGCHMVNGTYSTLKQCNSGNIH